MHIVYADELMQTPNYPQSVEFTMKTPSLSNLYLAIKSLNFAMKISCIRKGRETKVCTIRTTRQLGLLGTSEIEQVSQYLV